MSEFWRWLHEATGATPSALIQAILAVVAVLLIGWTVGTWLHRRIGRGNQP